MKQASTLIGMTLFGCVACSEQASQTGGEQLPTISTVVAQSLTQGRASPVGADASSNVPGATQGANTRHHDTAVQSPTTTEPGPVGPLQLGAQTGPINPDQPSSSNIASNGGNTAHHN